MQTKSWYKVWFDSPYYHILYKDRDDKEAAHFMDVLLNYFKPNKDAHFLDLACGRGRHSIYINQKGYRVTGIDLSQKNIKVALRSANSTLDFDVHDMRLPYRVEAFSHVLNLFTSFGYFSTIEKNKEVLTSAHYNLKEGGYLLIDFLNIYPVERGLVAEEVKEIGELEFKINRFIENGIIHKSIEVHDGDEVHSYEERVKSLHLSDFESLLNESHFEIIEVFGDYNFNQFDEKTSPRLILIARKN
jgi:SAM-dependent methyltransferase